MKFGLARFVTVLLSLNSGAAMAADIRVIVGGPLPAVFKELGPQFERDTGHKLNASFGATAVVKRQIDDGATFDLIVTNTFAIEDWIKEGKLIAASRTPLAYAGLGLGVRAGAARPDVSSAAALRAALLGASTVGHGPESASATSLQNVLARLGIADEMKPRLRPMGGGAIYKSVAGGEIDAIVAGVPGIVAAPGVDLAGAFPPELQTYVPFAAAVSAGARDPDAAQAFIRFLVSPPAAAVFRAKGLEPGAPR